MKATNVLFAGFGGHGMLLAGKILAYALMEQGRQVSWLPAYGAEMRGGTANVTVCVSDDAVGSPYIEQPDALVAMNRPSLDKFAPRVKSGGIIIINSTLVKTSFNRDDCKVLQLPAGDIAAEHAAMKSSNIVLLAAYAAFSKVVEKDALIDTVKKQFASKPQIIPGNLAAFNAGFEIGQEAILNRDTA